MKLVQILADIICNTLLDPDVLDRARNKKGAFTRNCGKLPYWTLIKLLLKNVKKTISASLDEFFNELRLASGASLSNTVKCSQQAFSKARTNLLYTIFVFDRGYASKNLISYIEDTIHAGYLFRIRSKFNTDIDALPAPSDKNWISDSIFILDGRKIRVLKFYLPSGVLETLITNDFSLEKEKFRQYYFLR